MGRSKRTKERALLLDFERSTNLVQIIKNPTRTTNNTKSLIDLLFVPPSILDKVPYSDVIEFNVSDHDIIFLVFKKDVKTKPKVTFTFWDLKNYNLAILMHKFKTNDCSDLYAAANPTACWNLLYDTYLAILHSVAPFITKSKVPAKDEWLDDSCLTKIQERDELRGKLRYSNKPTLRKEFNEARNVGRQPTNNARSDFVKRDIAAHAKSPKKFWTRLKSLMPGKKGDKSSRSPHQLG